jgi:alkylation response protein AidB-like acyl-CoA dehydrogenase
VKAVVTTSVDRRDPALVELGARLAAETFAATGPEPLDRKALLAAFAALRGSGYLGSTVPTAWGGAGLSHIAFGSLVEGVGAYAPFLSNHSVQRTLCSAGSRAIRDRWLDPLLHARAIGAVAITEPHGGSQVAEIHSQLRRSGTGLVLRGTKTWVTHAMTADVAVVLARGPDGDPVRVVVDLAAPRVRRARIPTTGLRFLTFGELHFEDCPVPAEAVLAGDGVAATKVAFAVARALVGVQAVALAQRAVEHTVTHLATRRARAREVTGADIIRHRIGVLSARVAAARLLCYQALAAIDDGLPGCDAISAGAKAHATDTARDVTAEAVELCAGAGVAGNSLPARCRDDAAMLATADGTSLVNHTLWGARVVRSVLGHAESGGAPMTARPGASPPT